MIVSDIDVFAFPHQNMQLACLANRIKDQVLLIHLKFYFIC